MDGQIRFDAGLLEDDDVSFLKRPFAPARIEAEHVHCSGRALAVALQNLDGGGLAGAVRSEEGEHLPGRHADIDSGDGLEGAIRFSEAADGNRELLHVER